APGWGVARAAVRRLRPAGGPAPAPARRRGRHRRGGARARARASGRAGQRFAAPRLARGPARGQRGRRLARLVAGGPGEDWPGRVEAIVAASARAAPMWLRVNRRRGDRDTISARLRAAGIEALPVPACADALRLDVPVPVTALPGFAEGELSVQDGSAQLVADALAPVPGARVLDACAAPGGKAA